MGAMKAMKKKAMKKKAMKKKAMEKKKAMKKLKKYPKFSFKTATKPRSAFLFWLSANRAAIRKARASGEKKGKILDLYKALSDKEKAPFVAKAARLTKKLGATKTAEEKKEIK